jgi:hypothetical protein
MPFDPSNFKLPANVVHVPPVTLEHGGRGPQRITINIEVVDRRTAENIFSGHRLGRCVLWLLGLLLLAAIAHAQPITYQHQQGPHGWRSETFRQGTVEDWTALGPHGEQRRCHSYVPGGAQGYEGDRVTTCQ